MLQLVEDTAARERFTRVTRLRLEVGALAGVELRALQFALEAIAPGTRLEGAQFEFEEPPGQAWCMGCAQSTPLARRGEACAHCGDYRVQPTGGMEFRLLEMLVED